MRTLSTDTEQIKLRELIEAARTEPVTVLENGEPAVVVLSPDTGLLPRPCAPVRARSSPTLRRRSGVGGPDMLAM